MGGSLASKVDSLYRVIKLGARSFGNNDLWRPGNEVQHVLGGGGTSWKSFEAGWGKVVEVEWLGESSKQDLMWEYMYGIKNVW